MICSHFARNSAEIKSSLCSNTPETSLTSSSCSSVMANPRFNTQKLLNKYSTCNHVLIKKNLPWQHIQIYIIWVVNDFGDINCWVWFTHTAHNNMLTMSLFGLPYYTLVSTCCIWLNPFTYHILPNHILLGNQIYGLVLHLGGCCLFGDGFYGCSKLYPWRYPTVSESWVWIGMLIKTWEKKKITIKHLAVLTK